MLLRNIGIGALYTSDLQRATETADVICKHTGIECKADKRLRERDIGRWQGLKLDEVKEWFPKDYEEYMADRMAYVFPGGESLVQVQERTCAAFNDILKEDAAETVAIVSHTVSIRVLLMTLIDGYDAVTARLGNSSVTTIARDGDGWKMVVPNDTMHLDGLESRIVKEMEDRAK